VGRAGLVGFHHEYEIRDLIRRNKISRGIGHGIGAVGINAIGNRARVFIRIVVIGESVGGGIETDAQEVPDRSGSAVGTDGEGRAGVTDWFSASDQRDSANTAMRSLTIRSVMEITSSNRYRQRQRRALGNSRRRQNASIPVTLAPIISV
jgi:hypothetical protein